MRGGERQRGKNETVTERGEITERVRERKRERDKETERVTERKSTREGDVDKEREREKGLDIRKSKSSHGGEVVKERAPHGKGQ